MNTIQIKRLSGLAGGWLSTLTLAFALLSTGALCAASVRDVAPTAADAPVMLDAANDQFGNFAGFAGPENSRLVATIGSASEVMYFGLSAEVNDDGDPFVSLAASIYRFQVRRLSDGVVVHGPFDVSNNTANVSSYEDAQYGVYPTDRVRNGVNVYRFAPGQAGDYAIEFEDVGGANETDRVLIPFWDFTVADENDNAIDGRVYSRSWAFRTPPVTGGDLPLCEWDRVFNGQFYSYTEDGFVSLIDFSDAGFAGLSFTIAFNRTGPGVSGDLDADRRSVPGQDLTRQAAEHRIFLSLPDENLFPSGECGQITAADAFRCNGPGEYCLDVSVTGPGQVEVLLDFNGNGIQDDEIDRTLVFEFTEDNLEACIPWNGLRGDGVEFERNDTVDLVITYAQGVQHWAAYDVEFMRNGFCVETVRPICQQDNQTLTSRELYWDDRLIPGEPGTGAPKDNRNGADCRAIPRTWDNFNIADGQDCTNFIDEETEGYGDKSTLNTYWFANVNQGTRARVPLANVSIQGETAICEGSSTVLTATASGGDLINTVVWTGPGVAPGTSTESITVIQPGEYCAAITSISGCDETVCVEVTLIDFNIDQFPDELSICPGESTTTVAGDTTLNYSWSPTAGIDDPASPNPTFSPDVTTVYTVTVSTDDGACSATEQLTVTVLPAIGLTVDGGGPICETTTTITANTLTPATIQFFDADGNLVSTDNPFTVAVSGRTNYSVVATNTDGCSETATFSVEGGPVDISLPDSIIACLTEEVRLNVQNLDPNDVLTYSWQPANLFEAGTANSANPVVIANPGAYEVTLTATNQFNCSATETLDLIVIDPNDALGFSTDAECDGLTINFNNTSTVGFGYLWLFGDGGFSTDENPTYTYATPGTYEVTLTLIFDQECVVDATRTVTVEEGTLNAGFTAAIGDCDGDVGTITFNNQTNNATGNDLTYMWTFTGATPATSSEESPTVTVEESGTVTATLVVNSTNGCESNDNQSFTVELNEIELVDITICPGETAELNPGGDGDGRTYTWSPSPDFDANDPSPETSTPGTYSVTVTSMGADLNCESVTTVAVIRADSVNLVINGPSGPLTGPDAIGGGDGALELPTVTTCGDAVDLSVDLNVNDSDLTITYTDMNGVLIGMGGTLSINSNGRDTVVVTAENADGCTAVDTIVIINSQVDASIDASAEGFAFCTSTDTTIMVMNNRPGDTLSYAWQDNDIITGPLDQQSVMITSPDSGMVELSVLVTNQFGCDTTITVVVQDVPFMPNVFPDVVTPCFAEAFTIMGGPAVDGYTYEYETPQNLDLTDPANPIGNFTIDDVIGVTITDPTTGCVSQQDIMVDVASEISFMASPVDTSICEPADVTVTGSTVNENAVITWYADAGLTQVINEGTSTVVAASEIGQSYTVFGQAVDPTSGCDQVVPVTVTVSSISGGLPLTDITACAGEDSPSIFGEGGPDPGLVYTYDPPGTVDDSDLDNPVFVGTGSGPIVVTVTDPLTGCSTSSTVNSTFTDLTGVMGMAEPADIFLGDESELTVTGCDGDSCTYMWMEPNGTISSDTGPSVIAMPDEIGTSVYEIDVTSNGCTTTTTIELRVEDPICDTDRVFVPNAFTPNGDNSNDEMRVRSNFADLITEFRFIIYDRWGQEVYNSENINDSWDGTREGDDLEPDVYGYWLRALCPSGEELIQQGNITLLR